MCTVDSQNCVQIIIIPKGNDFDWNPPTCMVSNGWLGKSVGNLK